MANENRDLMVARRNELKAAATQEGRQLAKGALEVSRKPLHDLGSNLQPPCSLKVDLILGFAQSEQEK